MINNTNYFNRLFYLNRFIPNPLSGLVRIPKKLKANPEKTFPASTDKFLSEITTGSMTTRGLRDLQYKSSGGYHENQRTIL
jgi:hypothetical protein